MNLLAESWTQRLGWVLIHFLWEGTIIALVLAVFLRLLTKASSHTRYALAGIALFICAIAPAITWTMLAPHEGGSSPMTEIGPVNLPQSQDGITSASIALPTGLQAPVETKTPWQVRLVYAANASLPYAVGLWFVGVIILSTRLTLGWIWMKRLYHSSVAAKDPRCLEKFESLLTRMQIDRPVRLLESVLVEVPTLIGWLRPTILMPVSLFVGMTPDQLEAIMAHELAHVRRYDYLVNLFQTVVETILFYHPAVWWISRKLREERENCCDDIALEIMTDKLVYVSALAQLEEGRVMSMALSASGGSLLYRIRRIVGANDRRVSAWPLWVLIIGILSVACLTQTKATEPPSATKSDAGTKTPAPTSQILSAVKKGDALTLQKLIGQGIDPNKVQDHDEPLLFLAGSPEVAEILIAHGANPNARDKRGYAALWQLSASRGKNTAAIVRVLLNHGADPNIRVGDMGETPVMAATDGETVDVLVEHGADLTAKLTDGTTVLVMASRSPADYFEALLRHGVAFDPKTDGPTLLVHASWTSNLSLINELLKRGVDPNASGVWAMNNGKPMMMKPMEAAVVDGQFETAKLLMGHGAKADEFMVAALHNRQKKIIKFFWDNGVRNISELCYAVSQSAPTVDLQKLLDQGVPADPQQDKMFSPLTIAAQLGNMDAVKLLILRGADVNKAAVFNPKFPFYQVSPLTMAASEGQDEIVSYLLQHGARPEPAALWQAAENSSPYSDQRPKEHFEKTVRILIDAGALKTINPEIAGYILSAPVTTRQGPSNEKVLKMLLDAGLSPESPMPYLEENGEKKNSVIGYFRDYYNKYNKDDPSHGDRASEFKPLLDMLEKADKGLAPKTTDTANAVGNPTVAQVVVPAVEQGNVIQPEAIQLKVVDTQTKSPVASVKLRVRIDDQPDTFLTTDTTGHAEIKVPKEEVKFISIQGDCPGYPIDQSSAR